jgi:uncharacterized protein YggE
MKRILLGLVAALVVALPAFPGGRVESSGGTIEVIGEGVVQAEPDQAQAFLGVETFDRELSAAVEQNQRSMDAVLQTLRGAGIPEALIQTRNYSVNFERDYPGLGEPPAEVRGNYRVSNMARVTIGEIGRLGEILDAAVEAGANQIGGVQFAVSDASELESQARALAVENARAKAEELAALADVSLGAAIRVEEISEQGGIPRVLAMEGMGGGAPVSEGRLAVMVRLRITYALR